MTTQKPAPKSQKPKPPVSFALGDRARIVPGRKQ
jgi:hypothetical protein